MRALFVAISLSLCWTLFSQSESIDFITPIKIDKPSLTGSFAEIRPNHFHAGIDYSTNGATGLKLVAVADGYVSRVKVSSTGYGKALYVTHYNGFTSVYAHSDSYVGKIDSAVTSLQYQNKSFELDHNFAKDEIVVKKGDVIALSGNSGFSGGPHLHFELRETISERVVNPYFYMKGIADHIAPKINSIVIYPLESNGTVNGKKWVQHFEVVNTNGKLSLKGGAQVKIAGKFAIGIRAYDLLDGSQRKCGVYSYSVRKDDLPVFYCDFYSIGFDETRYINSLIDYKAKVNNDQIIVRAYIDPNNHLSIYKKTPDRGVMSVEPAKKGVVEIELTDAKKNSSQLKFTVVGEKVISTKSVEKSANEMVCGKAATKELNGVNFTFSENSLYSDIVLKCSVTDFNKLYNSPVYNLGSKDIAIHSGVDVELTIPQSLRKYSKSLLISRIEKSGELAYVGGKSDKSQFRVTIKEFGQHVFSVDTVAPALSVVNVPKDFDYKGRKYVVVKAVDKRSEIASYSAMINGSWVLLEYDKKSDLLLMPIAKARVARNKLHQVEIRATDKMGNSSKVVTKFKY